MCSPGGLAKHATGGKWHSAPHLRRIDELILDCMHGKCNRLMLILPPRHGKSTIASEHTPPWWLGIRPSDEIILTSYEADFAATWSAKARDILVKHGDEVFGLRIKRGKNAPKTGWEILEHGGIMHTAGIDGSVTGRGANLFVFDDPVKNAKTANSKIMRQHAWDFYQSTAYTRMEPGGVIILIQTRWHEDDLAGRILKGRGKKDAEEWTVLRFPAIAEENDPLGRAKGEALWPERYPIERLLTIKAEIGDYWFSALFQGAPTSPDGAIFERGSFRYFEVEHGVYRLFKPDGVEEVSVNACVHIQTVDTALKDGQNNDYTVSSHFAVTPDHDMLYLGLFREKLRVPDQWAALYGYYVKHYPAIWGVEPKNSGIGIIQKAEDEGIPVEELKAEGDKILRCSAVAAAYKAGRVYHNRDMPELDDVEEELVCFPIGTNDDIVDTVAYGWIVGREVSFGGSDPMGLSE